CLAGVLTRADQGPTTRTAASVATAVPGEAAGPPMQGDNMHIDFVDQSLRDGQQSLWGMRMRAYEGAEALPHLARAGYRTIDLTGAGMFTVLLREYHDDPWTTLDFQVEHLAGNELRSGLRTISAVGFAPTPQAILDLWIQTLIKHGATSFWL